MRAPPLPNPERDWERSTAVTAVAAADVENRIETRGEPFEVLSGGLRNANVRVGAERVLRIYRSDPTDLGKELTLLRRRWLSFRVPAVIGAGPDFIVLEYVPHTPLSGSPEHGRAVGRALAEIHAEKLDRAGFVNERLEVSRPFDGTLAAFEAYALSELNQAADAALGADVAAFLAARRATLEAVVMPNVLLHADFKASNLHWTTDDRLLVLDWEFAYAGPALMDIGQLLRWEPPAPFIAGFAETYCAQGGDLPDGWQRLARTFDLFNLAGLLGSAAPNSRRANAVIQRIRETLALGG